MLHLRVKFNPYKVIRRHLESPQSLFDGSFNWLIHYSPQISISIIAIIVFCIAYFATVSEESSDPYLSLVVSQAIIDHQTVKLDDYKEHIPPGTLESWRAIQWRGHNYYYFPIGPSLFSIPFVLVSNQFGIDMSDASNDFWLQNIISALLCAIAVVAIYALSRVYLGSYESLIIATVSVLGTNLISTMGSGLWNLNFTVVFMILT